MFQILKQVFSLLLAVRKLLGFPSSANPALTSIRPALQHHLLRWLHTSTSWGCLLCLSKALNQTSSMKAEDVSSASLQSRLPSPAPAESWCQGCFSFLPALWHQTLGGIPSQWQIPRARKLSVLGAALHCHCSGHQMPLILPHPLCSNFYSVWCFCSRLSFCWLKFWTRPRRLSTAAVWAAWY